MVSKISKNKIDKLQSSYKKYKNSLSKLKKLDKKVQKDISKYLINLESKSSVELEEKG